MSTYETIRDAIKTKQPIEAMYEGHSRVMCPYALGHGKDRRERVLVYQISGGSRKGLPPQGQWKCLILDKLTNVLPHSGSWPNVINWNDQKQSCLDRIDVEV
jgi:hypothetical protein